MKTTLQAIRMLLVLTLLTGIAYPLLVTGIAQLAFSHKANGSLIRTGDKVIGSALLAQRFEDPRYFWPRASAGDFATVASAASNKGPTSADLAQAIAERRETFGSDAPADLLTASGSGLDPHLSPQAARHQIARVAQTRGLARTVVATLVDQFTEPRQFGFLGEPRVNVLALNQALEDAAKREAGR
jgi:K+-transporting ATPase ATPase C chain